MKKRFKILIVVIIAVCLCLIACGEKKEHEKDPESKKVRIYDVEPQDRPDVLMNVQHYVRLGVVKHVGYGRWETGYGTEDLQVPFANQLEQIEEASGAEIEYIVVDNWEELRKIQDTRKKDEAPPRKEEPAKQKKPEKSVQHKQPKKKRKKQKER